MAWKNSFEENYVGSPNGVQGQSMAVDVRGAFRNIRDRDAALNFKHLRRPYFDDHDRPCVVVNTGRWTVEKGEKRYVFEKKYIHDLSRKGWGLPPVVNATSLRKEEWLELDRVVLRAVRYRLRAWADLAAANSYGGFNGMAKTTLEYEQMSDPGEAVVDMTGLTPGRFDAPQFQLQGLPLPITHSDFWFSSRELAESRNTGTPLSTTMGEASGRRVAEAIEKTTIGVQTGVTGTTNTLQGGYSIAPKVYGYTNFTPRLTYTTLNTPTGSNPDATLQDVLNMRSLLLNGKFYGPYMIYHGPSWDGYMDNDYARAVVGTNSIATELTLRERLRKIEGIQDVRRLDMMFDQTPTAGSGSYGALEYDTILLQYTLIMVQMTPDVAQAVNGLDITTLQWETVGGMQVNFKCFSGDTSFVTRQGNKTLREMVGKEVEVLNRFGQWEKATVQSFGVQKLKKINFEHLNPVYATPEHQWWMRDGTRIDTTQLKQVPFTDERLGHAKVTSVVDGGRTEEVFCCVCPESQSFTLANGLTTSNCLAIQVPRLRCDYYSNCFAGETQFVTKKGNKTLREMEGQKVEVLNKFGKWETAEVKSFGVQKLQRINFDHLNPVYATADHQWWMKNGKRISTMELTQVPFTDESLGHAKVASVVDAGREEEVFCCVCPETHSFTLANGLTTSNCGILEATTH